MSLELKNVTKRVGADVYIHETNLVLEEGTFNILLGTTLAGKTTLMQLMAGLERRPPARSGSRQERHWRSGAEAQRLDGLPAVHQLPELHRLREHRLAAARRRLREDGDRRARGQAADLLRLTPMLQRTADTSSPAASSSAPRSRARWSRIPISSCSTSRSPTSTTSCARSCATSCRSSSPGASASSSMPRPSRPRRCCSAATRRRCTRGGDAVRPDREIYRRPADLTSAQVFSDPPINTAPW